MCSTMVHFVFPLLDGVYKKVGILVGMSIVQGGSGYPFFAPSVYDYITGKDVCSIYPSIEEVPDLDVRDCVLKVCLADFSRSPLVAILNRSGKVKMTRSLEVELLTWRIVCYSVELLSHCHNSKQGMFLDLYTAYPSMPLCLK